MENSKKLVFAFDLGSGSIGECVRKGGSILHAHSNLIDAEYASVVERRNLRHQLRTRQAHKQREQLWREYAAKAGIETLATTQPMILEGKTVAPPHPPDHRMLREFPAEGDTTTYNSALLRIALVQGRKLEGWQVFKAVWSALQHRGYDNDIPWKHASDEDDSKENTAAVGEYESRLKKYFGERKEFYLPCYYEAYRMGLWNPENPSELVLRLGSAPNSAHNKNGGDMQATAPRKLVEQELLMLLENAAKLFPSLQGNAKKILYGEAEKPYASAQRINGILDQKVPRFSNRIIGKCRLISRLNTCKAHEPLSNEVKFLLSLKNMRYTYKGKTGCALDPAQLTLAFERFKNNITPKDEKSKKALINSRDWKKFLQTEISPEAEPNAMQTEIPQPEQHGRTSFCRPSLKILKTLILSGKSPHAFYAEATTSITNTDKNKGLIKEDYKFLLQMPDAWEKIHISDNREEEIGPSQEARLRKIAQIIGETNNHIVRNRLYLLLGRLKTLTTKYGKPEQVFVEVARSSFLAKNSERLKEHNNMQKKAAAEWETATTAARGQSPLRMLLYRQTDGVDIYDTSENNRLLSSRLGDYEIDHIVPRSLGGSDSPLNMVLTKHEFNIDKGNLTPYEWFAQKRSKQDWLIFLDNAKKIKVTPDTKYGLRRKLKYRLLTSPEAAEMARRNTDLQATMYLEKLALQIVALFFGWPMNAKDEARRVFAVKGAQTAEIRRTFKLNRLLNPPLSQTEVEDMEDKKSLGDKLREANIKNRDNARHHALDAIIISLAGSVYFDGKTKTYALPYDIRYSDIAQALQKVYPQQLRSCAPKLRETIYALRCRIEKNEPVYYMTTRFNNTLTQLRTLQALKKSALESIFDIHIRQDFLNKFQEAGLTEENWNKFVDEYATATGRRIRALLKTDSAPFSKEEALDDHGKPRKVIGDYMQVGKMPGQYMRRKENHQGQLIYSSGKKNAGMDVWSVSPVYVFESLTRKRQEFTAKYGQVFFFQTGQLLELQHEVADRSKKIPSGIYKLRTIQTNGQIKIESIASQETYLTQLATLINVGGMRTYRHEFSSNTCP